MIHALRWFAGGAALPGAYLILLDAAGPAWAAAAVAAAALLFAAVSPSPGPRQPAAAAAGCAAGTLLLPLLGSTALSAAGLLVLVPDRAAGERRADPWSAALAAAGTIGLWRLLSFLLGHPLYAACLLAAAAAAGAAAGRAWKPGLRFPGGAAMIAGLALPACAGLLRLLGLNHLHPEHVNAPLLAPSEALSYCLHAAAGAAAVAFALASEDGGDGPPAPWAAAVLAPAAAAVLLPVLGAAETASAAGLALCLLGARGGAAAWKPHPILSRVVPAALLSALALAYGSRGALRDVAVNRLMAIFPGGEPLLWSEADGRALLAYRFSSGVKVALRDGLLDYGGGDNGRLLAHLSLAARAARTALFVDALHPEVYRSASAHGAKTTLWDRRPWCAAALAALASEGGGKPDAVSCGTRRPPSGPFDTIVVEVQPPMASPEAALSVTADAARRWKGSLNPGGVLAWRVPAAPASKASAQAAAALRGSFANVLQAPLGPGTLLLATDSAPAEWKASMAEAETALRADAAWLAGLAKDPSPWTPAVSTGTAMTAARPLAALPLRP